MYSLWADEPNSTTRSSCREMSTSVGVLRPEKGGWLAMMTGSSLLTRNWWPKPVREVPKSQPTTAAADRGSNEMGAVESMLGSVGSATVRAGERRAPERLDDEGEEEELAEAEAEADEGLTVRDEG